MPFASFYEVLGWGCIGFALVLWGLWTILKAVGNAAKKAMNDPAVNQVIRSGPWWLWWLNQ